MSNELKVYHCNEWHNEYTEFYIKSEVDKVIAEKDKEIAELKEQFQEERSARVDYKISARDLGDGLREAVSEIHHHRYKRCMDMVAYCDLKMSYWAIREIHEGDTGKFELYSKWHKRWLELADKFKGA